jgi:hypothetical protein
MLSGVCSSTAVHSMPEEEMVAVLNSCHSRTKPLFKVSTVVVLIHDHTWRLQFQYKVQVRVVRTIKFPLKTLFLL